MMKILLFVMTICVAMPTQAASDIKIAIVDIQKIVSESKATKHINSQLEQKKNGFQKEINAQEEGLMKEDKALAKKKAALSAEAFEKKRQEFQKKVADVQRNVQKKRVALEKAYTESLATVQKTVIEIIKDMAGDKKFSLAIPASQALYFERDMDISDEVLNKLNSKLPKVTVSVK